MRCQKIVCESSVDRQILTIILNLCDSVAESFVANMSLSLASILTPAHFFAYSTLLGAELYQSFVMTKIAYQALPRSAFTTLQMRVFPIYFRS
jgi:hypothetical protein